MWLPMGGAALSFGRNGESFRQPVPSGFYARQVGGGDIKCFGLSGLLAGVEFIKKEGMSKIREREAFLTVRLVDGLRAIKGVEVYGPLSHEKRSCVVSFNIAGLDGAEVAFVLDNRFEIMTRPGLHCAPWLMRPWELFLKVPSECLWGTLIVKEILIRP